MNRKSVFAWLLSCVIGCALMVGAVPAWAQPDVASTEDDDLGMDQTGDRPWAEGVSADEQATALALFKEGNELLKDSLFPRAAEKYREALNHWDHPGIHYNLALALLNLDQPLAVYETLDKAMRYGPQALDIEKFAQAQRYKKLVEQQLARIEVVCLEPDAKVSLNGKFIFNAPGKYESLVRVGEQSIVATKTGYITTTETTVLEPGDRQTVELELYTADDVTRYRRRWPAWVPWTVTAGGTVVAAVATTLLVLSRNNFAEFDQRIRDCGGCVPPSDVQAIKDSAKQQQTLAIVTGIVGGATLATGLVLVYLNRAKPYRIDVEQAERSVSIVPIVGHDAAGLSATFRF